MLTPCAQTIEQREARSRSELFTTPTWRLAEPPPWSHSSAGRSNAETFSAGLTPGAQRHRDGRRRSAGAAFRDVRAADHWHALPMPNEGTTVECPAPLQTRRRPRDATASGSLRRIATKPLQTPQRVDAREAPTPPAPNPDRCDLVPGSAPWATSTPQHWVPGSSPPTAPSLHRTSAPSSYRPVAAEWRCTAGCPGPIGRAAHEDQGGPPGPSCACDPCPRGVAPGTALARSGSAEPCRPASSSGGLPCTRTSHQRGRGAAVTLATAHADGTLPRAPRSWCPEPGTGAIQR